MSDSERENKGEQLNSPSPEHDSSEDQAAEKPMSAAEKRAAQFRALKARAVKLSCALLVQQVNIMIELTSV